MGRLTRNPWDSRPTPPTRPIEARTDRYLPAAPCLSDGFPASLVHALVIDAFVALVEVEGGVGRRVERIGPTAMRGRRRLPVAPLKARLDTRYSTVKAVRMPIA